MASSIHNHYGSDWITKIRLKGEDTKLSSSLKQVVSLEELVYKFKDPRFSSMDKVLFAVVIYYKKINHASSSPKGYYNRLAQGVTDDGKDNERTMTVMCLNSSPGVNTAVIPLSSADIDKYFMSYLIGRDDPGGFGPGAIIAIVKPRKITNYWGDKNGLPVLSFSRSFGLIDVKASQFKLNRMIPYSPNVVGNRLHGFYFPKVKLTVNNFNWVHTTCTGYFCDSVCMINPSTQRMRTCCPCVQSFRLLGGIVIEFDFFVDVVGGDKYSFPSDKFTSRTFTDVLTCNGVPMGITCEALNKIETKLVDQISAFIEFVNTSGGGFSLFGWIRVGRVKDQAADATKDTISSSMANYHITKLVPNCGMEQLKPYLLDISAMLKDEEELVPQSGGLDDGIDASKDGLCNDNEAQEENIAENIAGSDPQSAGLDDGIEALEDGLCNDNEAQEENIAENIAGSDTTEESSNMTRNEGDYACSAEEARDLSAVLMKGTERVAEGPIFMEDGAATSEAIARVQEQLRTDDTDEHLGEIATKKAKTTAYGLDC